MSTPPSLESDCGLSDTSSVLPETLAEILEETRAEKDTEKGMLASDGGKQGTQDKDTAQSDIDYSIFVLSAVSDLGNNRKRAGAPSAFMRRLSSLSFEDFKAEVFSSLSAAVPRAVSGLSADNCKLAFSVTRITSGTLPLQSADDYKLLLEFAMRPGRKSLTAMLAVESSQPLASHTAEDMGRKKHSDAISASLSDSDEETRPKKKKRKQTATASDSETEMEKENKKAKAKAKGKGKKKGTKIPEATDINPADVPMNDNIKLLTNTWKCNKQGCPSAGSCFVTADGDHLSLSNQHKRIWAAAMLKGEEWATVKKPPLHELL
ncbi:hypothetical protein FA95DRAFT_1646253 [Auriscalpium vulgare]|uniref:Uncharacterized protein n=1 Tax=Auriscalpium vulgare TaxID=40419 RepID=A0ACB8RB86_9AGAM|nr:hypothetical protein FA95DRAFT_1646253 [Auriscalpium vulgare]